MFSNRLSYVIPFVLPNVFVYIIDTHGVLNFVISTMVNFQDFPPKLIHYSSICFWRLDFIFLLMNVIMSDKSSAALLVLSSGL